MACSNGSCSLNRPTMASVTKPIQRGAKGKANWDKAKKAAINQVMDPYGYGVDKMVSGNPIVQQPQQSKNWDDYLKGPALGGMGLGSGMGGGGSAWSGTPAQAHQLANYDQPQMATMGALRSMGMKGLMNPYAGFEPIAQQARINYNQNVLPSLAERFTGMGTNALSSPSFLQNLKQGYSGLESNLAAQKAQYGLDARNQYMQMAGMGLNSPWSYAQTQAQPGLGQGVAGGFGKLLGVGIPAAIGGWFGGPAGAKAGAAVGGKLFGS